ncbi:MAG TPA: succinate dehydrogenase iron-sulfur subunit [bacterium]|nr:succinate dehydrogenase iron-sulfur subunit [bacterium]HQG46696.1 succinate dehydrogenase iron-sulfur subunit [bacterium]HQI47933.1 succinate dehydrogenase iron-sulfur subunit [bacterium]HQJ64418.1 succinate dehydrogenase iron-sulfur subunit [bacterium]HQJ65530.1 succinate dehydrogenase iron-sulfur subunit [bacterium]
MSEAPSKVTFEVLRYTPGADAKPRMQSYEVPAPKGLTVLDGLLWIKENLDPTLSWRSSCRMGVCGSCAMFINGLPRLACANQVAHLGGAKVVVKPLPNYAIIRDLVPDLEPFFAKHAAIKPYLIRKQVEELEHPTGEYFQSQEELINYIQFAYCIKCGACLAACPTVATDESYLGPQALAQAWRYIADSRDEGAAARSQEVFSGHGAFRCHFAGACSQVCPKGVDPAFAIQLMKQYMFRQKLGACKEQHGTAVAPPVENWTPREGVPKAPEHSV